MIDESKRIELKSPAEIAKMREAGKLLRHVFDTIAPLVQPGATTEDLDAAAHKAIVASGGKPAFLGLYGFPKTLCTSINEEIVHGIPSAKRVLNEGDIVSVDCGVLLGGFYADSATTYPVGKVAPRVTELLRATEESLAAAITAAGIEGARLGDIGAAVQARAERDGFGVVRDYTGHGIGRAMHEPPQVLNYGKPGTGMRLRPGLVLAIEPMVNMGTEKSRTLKDGWTVVTADNQYSAHFEHTIAITEEGPQVLTA